MIKIFCIVSNKCRTFKNIYISYIFKITLDLSIVCTKCGNEYKKIFKEKESVKILQILGLITNIEEYQKIYNRDWRKHKSGI